MDKEIKYLSFNYFVLRTPLISFNQFEDILARLKNYEQDFKSILQKKAILEAIYLGSPVLHDEILKFLKGKLPNKKEEERLKYSVLRYITRMSCRCTPFGLFAGCSMGYINEQSEIILQERDAYKRHTRLDMNYLCALSQDIAKIPIVKESVRFFPNTSIYEYGKQIRYVEYKYLNAKRIHNIISVDNSEYVKKVIEKAKEGAFIHELAYILVDEEISIEDASLFIEELIDSQLLVNELEPAITGIEYFEQLSRILEPIQGIEELKQKLDAINVLLNKIDSKPIGETQCFYNQIIDIVKELKTGFDLKFLFQSDMVKPSSISKLSQNIIDEVYEGLTLLNKLTPKYASNTLLSKFAESFYERYEAQSIQLLKVLDTELGIGYKQNTGGLEGDINTLIDDIILPQTVNSNAEIQWNIIQSILHQKFLAAYAEKKTEIEITDKDFEKLKANWDDLPPTLSVMCEIFSHNEDCRLIYLHSAGGSSAANLLGRFCHADQKLHQYVLNITQIEEELNPEVIFAEIVHLPESRIGNILLRPVLRKYEIPYLAKSAVDNEFQLPLSDLYISAQSGIVKLYSRRLKKQIIPRLSSAHNYSYNSMPVYHFLCDLQTQNLRGGIGFNWGNLANEYAFLPRVRYKNLILSLARWAIKKDDFKIFIDIKDDKELMEKIKVWKDELQIPRYVVMPDGDNEMFVDFDNVVSIRTLFSVIKKRPSFILNEFPFDINSAIVKDCNENIFTNEFILSFYKSLI